MAYTPGAGLKKPHNVIEGPIYPQIRRDPSGSTGRTGHIGFTWSRKHWTVDTGATLRDNGEHNRQSYEHAVLTQSRDYNQYRYGVSSHKSVVNKNFRPPLQTVEDMEPLSRLRRFLTVPRINPGTDTNTRGFLTQNQRPTGIAGHMTDRLKAGEWRPTFYAPMDRPVDNSRLPDLRLTLPAHSVTAGVDTFVTLDGEHAGARMTLDPTRPHGSVTAGVDTFVTLNGEHAGARMTLDPTRPHGSVTAGVDTFVTLDAADPRETQLALPVKPDLYITTNPEAPWMGTTPHGGTVEGGAALSTAQKDVLHKVKDTVPLTSYAVPAAPSWRSSDTFHGAQNPHFAAAARPKLSGFGSYHTRPTIPQGGGRAILAPSLGEGMGRAALGKGNPPLPP